MYDLIVLGGGPGGTGAAEYAARNGMRVALIERDRLGGTCLHRGCVPTKAYLHAAEAIESARTLGATVAANPTAMLAHKNEIVTGLCDGIARQMKAAKVDVFSGEGRLTGTSPFTVSVNDNALESRFVLIATGSRPARLPLPGCDNPAVWTSDDLLSGADSFASLLIVGGGVIGVEMACVYARLGVQVTILEAEKNCLPMMDRELGRSVEALLKSLGVTLLLGASLQQIHPGFTTEYEKDGVAASVQSERVLLATGRVPVTDHLPSELERNRRFIAVNEHYRTSIANLYAIGDVNGECQLAHAAHAQGVAAVSHMLGKVSPIDPLLIPSCVYTAPEIATVGLTLEEARAAGLDAASCKALTTSNARTLIEGLGRGFVKLVYDKSTRRLLGAQLFCGRATDLIGELSLAISQQLTVDALARAVHPHPTFCEAIAEAARQAG